MFLGRLLLRLFVLFVFNLLYQVKVKGLENIPLKGKLILAANHASFLDPMVLFYISPRRFHGVAGKWLFRLWWLGWVFKVTSCVPTNGSSKGAIAVLNKGEAILIFPEGSCETKADFLPVAHQGASVFALKTGAPVVPVYIKGTFEAWPITQTLPRIFRKIEVRFGPALYFEKIEMEHFPAEILNPVTAKIMQGIRNLKLESSG